MRCSSMILSLLLHAASGHGVLSNRTIDDQRGDIVTGLVPTYNTGNGTYGTVNKWNIGQTCLTCTLHPGGGVLDPGQAYDGTWHDASRKPGPNDPDVSVRIDFTGTAIYMYNILVNSLGAVRYPTHLEFYIDGDSVGTFAHEPDGTATIIYNALVYKNTTLSNTQHSLLAVMAGSANSSMSFFLFDYAIYTVEEPDAQPTLSTSPLPISSAPSSEVRPPKRTNTTLIASGVVGSVVALVALLLCLYVIHRHRVGKRLQSPQGEAAVSAQVQPWVKGHDCTSEVGLLPGNASSELIPREDSTGWSHGSATPVSTPSLRTGSCLDTPSIMYDPVVASSPVEPTAVAQLSGQIQRLQAQFTELRATRSPSVATTLDAERRFPAELAELAAFRGTMAALRMAEVGEQQQYGATTSLGQPPSYEHTSV